MRDSKESSRSPVLVLAVVLANGCGSLGSGCLRNSDCSSGQICVSSSCQIDPALVIPGDAGADTTTPEASGTLEDVSQTVTDLDAGDANAPD